MFRRISVLLIILAVVLNSSNLWAQSSKVDGTIVYKTNLISLDEGDSFAVHNIESYFSIGKLGLGTDISIVPSDNYLQVKPYATWKVGNGFDLVGGLATDSFGEDFADFGIWYFVQLGKVGLFADQRFFFGLNGKSQSFSDLFANVCYPLSEKFSLGVDLVYDHWWGSGSNWLLVGPVLSWSATDSVTVFTRVARETDFEGFGATDIRLGIKWEF